MPLPNPTYLSAEYYNWNQNQRDSILLDTLGDDSTVVFTWNELDANDRQVIHDLIMEYAAHLGLVELTAISGFVAGKGWQIADFGGAAVGGNATGLANDATVYTATITVSNGGTVSVMPITVTGSAAQTFTALIGQITSDLAAGTIGTAVIDANDNIKIQSAATGNDCSVSITDGDLFKSCTGFIQINPAFSGVDVPRDIFDFNKIHNNFYGFKYAGLIHTIAPAPARPVAPIDVNKVYFNHFSTSWKYLYNDSAVV